MQGIWIISKILKKKESRKSIKDKRYIFIKGDICDFKKLDKLLLKKKLIQL